MKRLSAVLIVALAACILMLFGTTTFAADNTEMYFVTSDSDGFHVFRQAGEEREFLFDSETLDSALSLLSLEYAARCIYFDSVNAKESITFSSGTVRLLGVLNLVGDMSVSEGARVIIDGAGISFTDSSLRIKGGRVDLNRGRITSSGREAVSLEYSASSAFYMYGGEVNSTLAQRCVRVTKGTASLSGGAVGCDGGCAIENCDTLFLGASLSLSGSGYDIVTDSPIHLAAEGTSFGSVASVKYLCEFSRGSITPVFYKSNEAAISGITLYDASGKEEKITFFESREGIEHQNFSAVYKPYKISFIAMGETAEVLEYIEGDIITPPTPPKRDGYTANGWYKDEAGETLFDFGAGVSTDVLIYAGYSLLPPEFTLSGVSTEYTGQKVTVDFSSLSHPLDDSGIYSFKWYREDGTCIASSRAFSVTEVKESGKYKCKVLFTVGGDTVEFETPYITVNIEPKSIAIPTVPKAEYTGKEIYADVAVSPYYTAEVVSGTNAGLYPIKFTLTDASNYVFAGVEGESVTVMFEILRAGNLWSSELSVHDIYFGAEPSPLAYSKFGSVYFLYSESPDGSYTTEPPLSVGRYYVRAAVDGTADYESLLSDPVAFSIMAEVAVSLSVSTLPKKTEYFAFEYIEREGLTFLVSYNSGREVVLPGTAVAVSYQNGDSLRYGDGGAIAEYLGVKTVIPLTVMKTQYAFSASFDGLSLTYDGKYHTIDFSCELPTGKDGIKPTFKIDGGGTDAGVYTVTVTFLTESRNYETPPPLAAELHILPREVNVTWGNTRFVYDGTFKCPEAFYTDVFGARHTLDVSGGAVYASDSYTAVATLTDGNYLLAGSETVFSIAKADYDMSGVFWDEDSFVYDGKRKTVTLCGLPDGVTVVGYTDNSAISAGIYTAICSLSYDTTNYNPPVLEGFEWRIRKADYDLSGIKFSSAEFVYDGTLKYPVVEGSIPEGADGSVLSYEFSAGVRDVKSSLVSVKIIFSSDSKNYNVPATIERTVRILPLGIYVTWEGLSFTYSGESYKPKAYAPECEIAVSGSGITAGEYTATGYALDSNYYVINNEQTFVIGKVENQWLILPNIDDIFFGKTPMPIAEAKYGEVDVFYYKDASLSEEANLPLAVGEYYMVCRVKEGINSLPLEYSAVRFEVIPVLPIAISAALTGGELFAFERIPAECILCTVTNNDGTSFVANHNQISIRYINGESLRATDGYVTVVFGDFEYRVTVSVEKADFDMTEVKWQNTEFVYDGEGKTPHLAYLPKGLRVISYTVTGAVNAGEYVLGAEVEYDSENYNEPVIPYGKLIISKKQLTPAFSANAVYDGTAHTPVSDSELYFPVFSEEFVNAGQYTVSFALKDGMNYEFLGDGSAVFVVEPMTLYVTVNDRELYLFEEIKSLDGRITGGIPVSKDEVGIVYEVVGDRITAYSTNKNYRLVVTDGQVIKSGKLSPDILHALFVCFLLFVIFAVATVALVYKREAIAGAYAALRSRRKKRIVDIPAVTEEETECDSEPLGESVLAIDVERAEALITNSMAKTLVRKSEGVIYTSGHRRVIINIDTLSENFSSGDVIDINVLKEKGLVVKDAGYVKVLARGIINKPLRIYANDFSLAAVKMIALTGGEANTVRTARLKK